MKDLTGTEITSKAEQEEYLHQICCVFEFLGEATQAKVRVAANDVGYTFDADFGHYLIFNMAISELKKFGGLVGLTVDDQETMPGGKK